MIKTKDLVFTLCDDLNYRFFCGVRYKELEFLYKYFSVCKMRYVEAIDEVNGLGISFGAALSGMGSVFFLDLQFSSFIYNSLNFLISSKAPIFIMGFGKRNYWNFANIPIKVLKKLNDVVLLSEKMDKDEIPGILIIEENVLK